MIEILHGLYTKTLRILVVSYILGDAGFISSTVGGSAGTTGPCTSLSGHAKVADALENQSTPNPVLPKSADQWPFLTLKHRQTCIKPSPYSNEDEKRKSSNNFICNLTDLPCFGSSDIGKSIDS